MPSHHGSLQPDVYRAAMEASPSPTVVTDAEGIIVLANREAERLFGWKRGTWWDAPSTCSCPKRSERSTPRTVRGIWRSQPPAPWVGNATSGHVIVTGLLFPSKSG